MVQTTVQTLALSSYRGISRLGKEYQLNPFKYLNNND